MASSNLLARIQVQMHFSLATVQSKVSLGSELTAGVLPKNQSTV